MFIVIYDDEDYVMVPYQFDDDCDGALCSGISHGVACFESKLEARLSIQISRNYMRLRMSQNKPHNSDFDSEFRKFIKIIPLVSNKKLALDKELNDLP